MKRDISTLLHLDLKKEHYILILSFLTLSVYFVASYFPTGRVWGINLWGFFPDYVSVIFFSVFTATIATVYLFRKRIQKFEYSTLSSESSWKTRILISLIFASFGAAVFWTFKTETHFLGDGYHVLTQLASSNTQVKNTETGTIWMHMLVADLIGLRNVKNALTVYQVLSVSAGFLFLFSVCYLSHYFHSEKFKRLLLIFGISTGGYALLYFGYVEHYSWMTMFVTLMTLAGILSVKGNLSKWYIVSLYFVALFLHVATISLLPAIIYLLVVNSRLSKFPKMFLWMIAGASILAIGALFTYFYNTSYFFKFAFVPIVPNEITAEGYTLFSLSHLLDFANLLWLLLPPLLLFFWLVISRNFKAVIKLQEYRFLFIMLLSTGFFLFILDPKLGMPRDWDLFSLVGVPLVVLHYYWALDSRFENNRGVLVAAISILVSLAVLAPRIASVNTPDVAIAHLDNYMKLDRAKNRAVGQLVEEYYVNKKDADFLNKMEKEWFDVYPEVKLTHVSVKYLEAGDIERGIQLNETAISKNPMYWNAYSNLGGGLLKKGMNDSALKVLQIADGINPHNPVTMSKLGYAWYGKGEKEKAEKILKKVLELDSTATPALVFLGYIYNESGRTEEFISVLKRLGKRENSPTDALISLMEYYLSRGEFEEASKIYQKVEPRGLDSSYSLLLFDKFPEFRYQVDQ